MVLAILWGVLLLSLLIPAINNFGIRPRAVDGLSGIAFSPLLHANWQHLAANCSGLLILGWILYGLEGLRTFWIVASIIFFCGLGTWIIGRSGSVHIGASGLVYGLFGYILAAGFYKRSFTSVAIAAAVLFFYGGSMFMGALPIFPGVSWEAHVCGFFAGVGDARYRCSPKAA